MLPIVEIHTQWWELKMLMNYPKYHILQKHFQDFGPVFQMKFQVRANVVCLHCPTLNKVFLLLLLLIMYGKIYPGKKYEIEIAWYVKFLNHGNMSASFTNQE